MNSSAFALALVLVPTLAFGMGSSKPSPVGPSQSLDPGEPAYCNPPAFMALRQTYDNKKLDREHLFQLGAVKVMGLAVGDSEVSATQAAAVALSRNGAGVRGDRYCTFYYNDGSSEAEDAFVWEYLSKPTGKNYAKVSAEYMSSIGDLFDTRAQSFLGCAERSGYIAMGCDGMRHRGPSVFGMLLSYSGCSPKRAAVIVNAIWGTNGIEPSMREALNQKAFDLGRSHATQSARLRALFSGQ